MPSLSPTVTQPAVRFGKLILNQKHIEAFGPHAWPMDQRTDERFKTVDKFQKALHDAVGSDSPFANPVELLDLHGINVDVHGDHGYLSVSFRDKKDNVRVYGSSVLEGPTADGSYSKLVTKLFQHCLIALDDKLRWSGLDRIKNSQRLLERAEEAEQQGRWRDAAGEYTSRGLSLEMEYGVKKMQYGNVIGQAFYKATECMLKAMEADPANNKGLQSTAQITIRDAVSFDPKNETYKALAKKLNVED